MNFHQLHQQKLPLLLANVWDVSSAKTAKNLGFDAIGTSSAAIASMYGYDDGENMPFALLLQLVERIRNTVDLPLSVDIEAGYSRDTQTILAHIQQLVNLGVVGINIEDSIVTTKRQLQPIDKVVPIIASIKNQFGDTLFINVRTDTFLLAVNDKLKQTQARLSAYTQAGADGGFVPCLTDLPSIKTLCQHTTLPINLMAMPQLANFTTLSELGVKRLSMGNFGFEFLQQHHQALLKQIQTKQSFDGLFA